MDNAFSVTGSPALVTDDLATPGSILGQMTLAGKVNPEPIGTLSLAPEEPTVHPWSGKVNYAPGSEDPSAVTFGKRNRDPFVIDLDTRGGLDTVEFLRKRGEEGTTQTVLGAQLIGGLAKSRDWLMERPEGQRLLSIIARDRAGKKRDLWEALGDVGPSDLPFMSLVGTQSGSIANAVRVSDTFKKLQSGEQVTDDEALSATLFLAESRRSQDGTFGAMVGDIVRAAPGFMLEFLATGSLGSVIRSGAMKAGAQGIHVGMTRASKVLARELIEAEAVRAGAKTAEEMSKRGILKGVAESIYRNTLVNNPLYEGIADDALRSMALKRAEYEAGQYVARTAGGRVANGFNSFLQWGKNHISRGIMDFGSWGTEEATVAFTGHTTAGRALADAVGAFLVEAPIKGVAMWAPNQYAAKPLIEAATGNDRSVSRNQLSLMQQALFSGNEAMMADAEAISLGQDLLEYVSENAGRGFGALLRGAGLLVDKAGAKALGKAYVPLLTPASQRVRAAGADFVSKVEGTPLVSEEAGVSVGGKIREWVQKVLGTREDFNRRTLTAKSNAVIRSLGVTSDVDKEAVRVAILSNSTAGLRRDLAAQVGPDMGEFAKNAMRTAFTTAQERYEAAVASGLSEGLARKTYDEAVKELQYKSFARFAVADYMAQHGINPTGIMNLYARMGYDGILGEMFEERYSDVAKGLFNLDERKFGEKWWNLDFKEAVKGLYPGFDQLAAEAIGFAFPMVTRTFAMRMAAKAGGDGVVNETKNILSAFRDVTRTDEIFQMPKGDYLRAMDRVMEMSAKAVTEAEKELAAAETSGTADEERIAGLKANLEQLRTVDRLRRERHTKWLAVEDIAKANAEDLVSITGISDQRLLSPEGARTPVYSSADTEQSAAGRNAMVDYSPKLARTLYEFQSSFEGQGQPFYRWIAQKAIGFTAGLATGDFSAMRGNAVEWHARDYGLSPMLCFSLKDGYAREFERQKGILTEKGKEMAARGAVGTYSISREEIMKATDEAFAPKARELMSGFLEASNFRTFTQNRFRDQAILQYARQNGYEYVTRNANGEEIAPEFYKVNADGSFDDASMMTVDQMEQNPDGTVKDEIKEIADDIAAATVNVMTRHLTRPEYAKSALMRLARLPKNFDGISMATVESALALCGRENLVTTISVDGTTPLKDLVPGQGVAKVNMDVVSFIARHEKADDVDPRAIESVAQSMGMRFDGSEESLKKRNERVFRLAKLANATMNGNVMYFAASTAKVEDWDTRMNSGNAFLAKAERQDDGTYVIVKGVDPEHPTERVSKDNSVRLTKDAMVAHMKTLGYEPATARIVFTQARAFEFSDMFTALRELNLVSEYDRLCESADAMRHPMLEKVAGTKAGYLNSEEDAKAILDRKLGLAALWNPDLHEVVGKLPDGESEKTAEKAYKELWDPQRGFMAIGERLLRSVGVRTDNPITRYAGEFRPYVGTKYTMRIEATRLSGDMSADVYVPVDAMDGFDYTSALFNAHLMDSFQKRPQFLKDAMGPTVSDFVEDVWRATEAYLRDPDVQKDKDLVEQLKRFRDGFLKQCDRPVKATVTNPRTKAKETRWKTVRGRELTPRSFAVLASQFAMFRAGEYDLSGDVSRATALIAPLVYRSPSFVPFMNVVDLTLGGNGFLSEMIANGNKKAEEPGAQRGIRGLMAAAAGDPSSFRRAFAEKALPLGVKYEDFLDRLVQTARNMPKTGVESVETRDGKAASEAIREAKASVDVENLRKTMDTKDRAAQEKIDAMETQVRNLAAESEQKTRSIQDLTAKVNEGRVKIANLTREIEKRTEEARRLREGEDLPENLRNEIVNLRKSREALVSTLSKDRDRLKREVRSADGAGVTNARIPVVTVADANAAIDGTRVDPVDEANTEDLRFTVEAGFDDFQRDLPPAFDERTDGNPLDIRFGTDQKLGYELTPAQAKLSVNLAIRAALADGEPVYEGSVVHYAKTIFRGFTESDFDAMREQYRVLADLYARRGRLLEDLDQLESGDLWAEDEREDDSVSEDSFNEKSVAEFESKELGDFLALAWKASSETGRNFQALVSNIREFNRWQMRFTAEHASEYTDEARAAVEFMNRFLNPRGIAEAKTMADRLAVFERQLRLFDTDPVLIQRHLKQLMSGGRNGRPLSRKGAMLLSYLMSLRSNDRNRFAVLVSNSLVTSAIHLDPSTSKADDEKTMIPRTRGISKTSEGVVADSFSDLVGKSRAEIAKIAADAREAIRRELGGDKNRFRPYRKGDELNVIRHNGMEIALRLGEVFGPETPLFSALTSQKAIRYMASVLYGKSSSETSRNTLVALAKSMTTEPYLNGRTAEKVMAGRTGIEFVDIILSTLDSIAESGEGPVTREEISSWFVTAFSNGDPKLSGLISTAPSSSRVTSPLMTLMSMFDSSLPETVARADFDPRNPDRRSSVAVASRGLIPLGNRFMDREFERFCRRFFRQPEDKDRVRDEKGGFKDRSYVESLNPGMTFEEVLAECRSDMTWPDEFRTPIFAKSLSKGISARQALEACERTFNDKNADSFYIPVYAGDHSSAVLIQIPTRGYNGEDTRTMFVTKESPAGNVIRDVFGKDIPETRFTRTADRICELLGLDLLGTDAKRSALSSLECEGAAFRGAKGTVDAEGNPEFGENRIFIMTSLAEGFSNEEMKGKTLVHGYGADQLRSMAKDPNSKDLKAHIIGTGMNWPTFIKSLSSASSKGERYAKGTALRAMQDWLEKQVKDEFSTGIFTDWDSYKIGVATNGEVLDDGSTLMDRIMGKIRELYDNGKGEDKFDWDSAKVDEMVGPVMSGGKEMKVSELMPGVRVQMVDGLGTPTVAVSLVDNSVIGYTVANVSHDSGVPNEVGRTPRNQTIDAFTWAASLLRLPTSKLNPVVAQRAIDMVADWGVVASASISNPAFMDAMRLASSGIGELMRYGEDPEGQNVKAELVRVVNAQLRKFLNMPVNAIDAALDSCCASRDKKTGEIHDHTKDPTYRAMNRGSKWFAGKEAEFWGVDRQVPLWNCNVRAQWFRNTWFLDEEAVEKHDLWLRGVDANGQKTQKDYWDLAEKATADWKSLNRDQKLVLMFEQLFTDLRNEEADGRTERGNEIRRVVSDLFIDQYGKTLSKRTNTLGQNVGESRAQKVSFDDLFHELSGSAKFDRSAFRINTDYGKDRIRLESDGEKYEGGRIALGGTMIGLPRTPSYNALLVTGRAGLFCTETDPLEDVPNGQPAQGPSASVMPDPQTLDTEGIDFDGDKTKLYFLMPETDGARIGSVLGAREDISGLLKWQLAEKFVTNEATADGEEDHLVRSQVRAKLTPFMERKRVDEDGRIVPVSSLDEETHDNEFMALSDRFRRRVANDFARAQFDMALTLPNDVMKTDGSGTMSRVDPNTRVDAIGSAAMHATGPLSFVDGGKKELARLTEEAKIPEAILAVRGPDGKKVNRIGKVRVAAVVSDGARDAQESRANVVSVMKDIHFGFATGMFFAKDGRGVFNCEPEDVIRFLSFVGRADGISNSTFDDMKEQICSRLGWRPGMMDVLFTDLLANLSYDEEGKKWVRGRLPSTKDEFFRILKLFSARVNKKGSSRWWMDRISHQDMSEEYMRAVNTFGNKYDSITYKSVCDHLGIERVGDNEYDLGDKPTDLARRFKALGGNLAHLAGAGRAKGHNPMAGYLMGMISRGDKLTDREIAECVAWANVHFDFREMRDVVKSFNYTNVDVGDDTESGRRDRVADTFRRFAFDRDGRGLREVVKGGRFKRGGYDIFPAMVLMNATMRAAYDVGNDLMTNAARGALASERYSRTVERLAVEGGDEIAPLVAKSMLLDTVASFKSNRMQLEANAQQIPYALAGLETFADAAKTGVEGSPIDRPEKLYNALLGIAGAVVKQRDSYALGMCRGIEAMFEAMYRLAVTSDEHFRSNNVFAYFREDFRSRAFSATEHRGGVSIKRYGDVDGDIHQIMPAYGANTEASVAEIRRKVDRIIRGKSFAGKRTNTVIEEAYRGNFKTGTFSLSADVLTDMAKGLKDGSELKRDLLVAAKAVEGIARSLGVDEFETGSFEVTPAMMFGQLLPMYSVLTSRTLGAPSPSSPSILNLLPDRFYRDLSAKQVENDKSKRDIVDLLVALNWAPRDFGLKAKYTEWYTNKYRRTATKATKESLNAAAAELVRAVGEMAASERDGLTKAQVDDLRQIARGRTEETKGLLYNDYRRNPDYAHLMDPFAASGLLLDAVKARMPVTSRRGAERTPSITEAPETPVKGPMRPECVRYARTLGALAGSWAKVRYLGGDVFELCGNLKGNLAEVYDGKTTRTHRAKIIVTVGDVDFLNDEASVEALANSYSYAASLAAVTEFRTSDGKPMTAERFLAMPFEVRKAIVRRYGIGAAASNQAAWSLDAKGVATLCGAIRLANGRNGTKVYHEYFHAMMRFYDALGMFTGNDLADLATYFNKDGSDSFTRETEEQMAEAFRKWVERNTEPPDTQAGRSVLSVFRKLMDFLKGFLAALKRGFTYAPGDDANAPGGPETVFKMAVHGIAQSSMYLDDIARQNLMTLGVGNADDVQVAGQLRHMVAERLRSGESRILMEASDYTEDVVRELLTRRGKEPTAETVAKVMEALHADPGTKRFRDTKAKLDNMYKARKTPEFAKMQLDTRASGLSETSPSGIGDYIQETIDSDYQNVTQEDLKSAAEAETKALDVLRSATATPSEIRDAVSDMMTVRCALAEKAGYEFSADQDMLRGQSELAEEDALYSVDPGTPEHEDAEIEAAADAATRNMRFEEKTAENEVRRLIFSNIEAELRKEGRFDGTFEYLMRALGNPKPTEVLADRNSVIVGIRAALQAIAPDAEISKETIEKSMAFEAMLTMYNRLESTFKKGAPRERLGEGARRWKRYASAFDVAGWILSDGRTTPGAILNSALERIAEARDRAAEGTPSRGELSHLYDSFRELRLLLSDSTGLLAYRRGQAEDILNTVFVRIRAGLMPKDAEQGSDKDSWEYFDTEGFQKDLKPVVPSETDDAELRKEASEAVTHRMLLQGCVDDPAVQEALKLALRTAYELSAAVKYQDEFEVVPPNAEDIAFKNEMSRRGYAASVGEADWFASQSLSSSHLMDNRNLVEVYDQSYFIASDPDTWLSSQVRKTFGRERLGDMMQAEHREYGAIKSEILRLENYYSFLHGDNVEADGEILKLFEQDREFSMEFGTVVHGQFGKTLKFDNYRKVGSGTKLTQEDLVRVDLFKKAAKAIAQRQDRLVTGADRLVFGRHMSVNPGDYTIEAINEKERRAREENGKPLNPFEETLWRLGNWQLPDEILHGSVGVYDRLVATACEAMREARAIAAGESVPADFDFNTHVLRRLEAEGLCVAELNGKKAHDNKPGYRRGAVTLKVKDFMDFWERPGGTLDKLVKARWIESDGYLPDGTKNYEPAKRRLSADAYIRDMSAVYRKAARFAKAHPWLTTGDGKFMNMFGTCLPFFGGSGVFMYMANRRDRAEKRSYVKNLSKYEKSFSNSVVGDKANERIETTEADLLYFLHDMYETRETGEALRTAIMEGRYEEGPDNDTGLVLGRFCTTGDIADAIYSRLLERADREEAGLPAKDDGRYSSADRILKSYEEARGVESDMFGGSTGLNDVQMFRLHGVLPANDQLGHAVHKAIDGITNALMHRNTLANMLMTPNADGSPVFYAKPDTYAVQASGLPDSLWENVARWWCEWNGLKYDERKSGVENARDVYDVVNKNRQDNKGTIALTPAGAGDRDYHRYSEFPKEESDLASVQSWLAVDDEQLGDNESRLNWLSGGEAMGYLRQFCQASRVLGFGGPKVRASLHRCLSWSKTMSVSFSFFFPLATKWESPIGAVGAMATIGSNRAKAGSLMREHPELFNGIQKIFGGRGWITKDFLGFTDVIRMMDSNDPFLSELVSWAEALGVKITDRFVNPVEPTRGIVDADIRNLKRMLLDAGFSARNVAKLGRKMDLLFSRQSEKSFSYALNATKLATVAQLCMKLRAEAARRGKAFDPVRDLRRYSGYINAEIGGIDPLKYAWATPRFRGFMNCLLFSWEWTRGAWEAGGGTVLEDIFLGGHNATPEERMFYLGRWGRMFGEVMIGIPALIQLAAWALADRALAWLPDDWFAPGDDDKRKKLEDYVNGSSPFIWDNERKTRWTAADLTPLLKVIGSADVGWLPFVKEDTTLAEMKARHPFALGWLPAYTGTDSANRKTGNRRLYLHFGKQGWEEFRWFDKPLQQFFSKLSMPAQRILEGVFGRNLGYLDRALPWEDQGFLQRLTDPSFDGALWNVASAFLPFSVSGMVRTGDAGIIPIFGPVQYGASYSAVNDEIVDRLEAFANNDRRYYTRGYRHKGKIARWSQNMLADILADARANGVSEKDLASLIPTAAGQVKGKMYNRLFDLIPTDPEADFDAREINRLARSLNRLGVTYDSTMDALKKRLGSRDQNWSKDLTPQQRSVYRTVFRGFKSNPFSDKALEDRMNAARESAWKPMDY